MRTSTPAYRLKPDALVAARAAESLGVLSLDELFACGITEAGVARRVAAGHLHRIHRGVYAVGHAGITQEGRWLAAVKAAGPGAVLSHHSAAMLYGFLGRADRRPDVIVTTGRAAQGVRVHRTRALHPHDVRRHRGIPATSPARTILDLAARMNDVELRRMMSRAQSMYLVNLRELAAILDRTGNRPGRARYVAVLSGGPKPTRTDLEDRVLDVILAAGFRPPDVNRALHLDGRRVIPDFRWPEQRLCVEADSRRWHDTPQAGEDDAERQAILEAHGERVVRVTWRQAVARPAQTAERLANAGAPRL